MRRAIAGSVALTVALTVGLSAGAPQAVAATRSESLAVATTSASTGSPETQAAIDKIRALIPDLDATAAAAQSRSGAPASDAAQLVRSIINPSDYVCPPSTPLLDWILGTLQSIRNDPNKLFAALIVLILDPITYDALLNEPQDSAVYGPNGEFTIPVTHTFKDLQRFWNLNDSSGIRIAPMHGSVLLDHARMTRVFQVVYGLSAENAAQLATAIAALVKSVPEFNGGNFPLFTFNAFAISANELGGLKIAMGDGILQGFQGVGLGDVAPQAILAHEYGHQVQFANNLALNYATPEDTRRVELMADAYSAYFLSHARGAAMQTKRIQEFLGVYYNVGDCGFGAVGHHGTPAQRQRTGEWASSVANAALPQGFIIPGLTFSQMFDAKLPELVAPDAN